MYVMNTRQFPTRSSASAATTLLLTINIRKCVHVVVSDLAMAIDVPHFCSPIHGEIVVLIIEGGTVIIIDCTTIGVAIRDYEIVMNFVGGRYIRRRSGPHFCQKWNPIPVEPACCQRTNCSDTSNVTHHVLIAPWSPLSPHV
jgi:hypothetical protein